MKKPVKKLTQKRLKELLHYNQRTGVFKRIVGHGANPVGSESGCAINTGYIVIGVDGNSYLRSRLAFLYMLGYFPEHDVDHINRKRDDDRWENLREATRSCNQRNTNMYKNNTTGVVGVYWDKINKKYTASISTNKKLKTLGVFVCKEDAVFARFNGEQEIEYYKCNNKSSAYNYLKERNLI